MYILCVVGTGEHGSWRDTEGRGWGGVGGAGGQSIGGGRALLSGALFTTQIVGTNQTIFFGTVTLHIQSFLYVLKSNDWGVTAPMPALTTKQLRSDRKEARAGTRRP